MVKPTLHGREIEPGWYWVLRRSGDELEPALLTPAASMGRLVWFVAGETWSVSPELVTVHSGPIAHPYEGRWSGCPHAPEFRRGKRCVQCGTLEVR